MTVKESRIVRESVCSQGGVCRIVRSSREDTYGPQHRNTTTTTNPVTPAALLSSLSSTRLLILLALVFMELLRLLSAVRSSCPVELLEGERQREALFLMLTVKMVFPLRELRELHLREEREFLRVRTEFPFATKNILT